MSAKSSQIAESASFDCAEPAFRFGRLSSVAPEAILKHLRNSRVGRHLPLLVACPDRAIVDQLIGAKEACWERDGLGHWAIFQGDEYVGWGGFQKEGEDWDFGLVLRPEYFRYGKAIAQQAFAWARAHTTINKVTFLLPPSRSPRALLRLEAQPLGVVQHSGMAFRKWTLTLRGARDRSAQSPIEGG